MIRFLLSIKPFSTDAGLLLLRLFAGPVMMYYGWDKLANFSEKAAYWPDPFHIGGAASLSLTIFGELICPFFIAIGLFTRVALVPSIINMVMAIAIGHIGQPLDAREHALSFLIPYVVLFLAGPGRFSLDGQLRK
jgi:putative oxidoreductase